MKPLLVALVLAPVGLIAAALWTYVLRLAGVPGTMLTRSWMARRGAVRPPLWATVLTAVALAYVALVFTAFIVGSAAPLVADAGGWRRAGVWAVVFVVACSPGWMLLSDTREREPTAMLEAAAPAAGLLATAGFFGFAFAPQVVRLLWGWVPHF